MSDESSAMKLEDHKIFPLYSASNKVVRIYSQELEKLNLTYTQYLVMLVLWEKENINEKELGEKVFLKSNTLTPLLNKLVEKGYVRKSRNVSDIRNIVISLTPKGRQLKEQAASIQGNVADKVNLNDEESQQLFDLLMKILKEE